MNVLFQDIKIGEKFHWNNQLYEKINSMNASPYSFVGETIYFDKHIIVHKYYNRHVQEFNTIKYGQDEFGKYFAYVTPMLGLPIIRVETDKSPAHAALLLADSLSQRLAYLNNANKNALSGDF